LDATGVNGSGVGEKSRRWVASVMAILVLLLLLLLHLTLYC
jgi:hypothetical protein